MPLPEIAIQTEQMLRELNPEYEITVVDNKFIEPFIRENYGDIVWNYYLRIDPSYGAVRADFLRYLILYKEGGIYTDLKVSASKPFTLGRQSRRMTDYCSPIGIIYLGRSMKDGGI